MISKRIINKWKGLKRKGDVLSLSKSTGKTEATISRVLNGKQEPSIELTIQITEFFNSRKKQLTKINCI